MKTKLINILTKMQKFHRGHAITTKVFVLILIIDMGLQFNSVYCVADTAAKDTQTY
jgi:hypothetical protein